MNITKLKGILQIEESIAGMLAKNARDCGNLYEAARQTSYGNGIHYALNAIKLLEGLEYETPNE